MQYCVIFNQNQIKLNIVVPFSLFSVKHWASSIWHQLYYKCATVLSTALFTPKCTSISKADYEISAEINQMLLGGIIQRWKNSDYSYLKQHHLYTVADLAQTAVTPGAQQLVNTMYFPLMKLKRIICTNFILQGSLF